MPAPITQTLLVLPVMRDALNVAIPGGEWPEDRKVRSAEQPSAIGRVLVHQVHKHLVNVSIGYLFVEDMGNRDRTVLAKASKTSGPLEFYSEHTFLVRVNWTQWRTLTPAQKVALMDHELCHFGTEEGNNGTRYVMLSHDLEEFISIVQRHGLWRADLKRMANAMGQRDLFDTSSDDTPAATTGANEGGAGGPDDKPPIIKRLK